MLETIRIMTDFGLLILIWLVQLIIYPSFLYMDEGQLKKWHDKYTLLITYFVAPLLFTQTGILAYQLFDDLDVFSIVSFGLVVSLWLLTFFQAVPLHSNISNGVLLKVSCEKLVQKNRIRTALWTLLWFIGLIEYLL